MGAVIRALVPEDRADVEQALLASGAFNDEEVRVALELFDAGQAEGYWLFGVVDHDRVWGYVCVGKASLTQSSWYLYWLCVHPDAQRQGVGRALQAYSEAFVAGQGGRRLVLETSGRADYDRVRRFYTAAGYRIVGTIVDFYAPGDDCMVYVKDLCP